MKSVKELMDLLHLKETGKNTFEGVSESVGSPNVFGGQVLAQALNAAYRTVPKERNCHSLHAYFILPGDLEKPIDFRVQRVRDGGSFTTRYITAQQDEAHIFVMAASFQKHEEGLEYQVQMPEVPQPEELPSWDDIYEQAGEILPPRMKTFLSIDRPITIKPTVLQNPFEKKSLPPIQNVWFKFKTPFPDPFTPQYFQEVLAYTSDYNILFTALHPHTAEVTIADIQMASLDHAMWFHRLPENFDEWFLYSIDAESTSNARGLTAGNIFDRKGKLIASVAQEGLIRRIKK